MKTKLAVMNKLLLGFSNYKHLTEQGNKISFENCDSTIFSCYKMQSRANDV
jgi:hypothetical protein